MKKSIGMLLCGIVATLALQGCASVSVNDKNQSLSPNSKQPSMILVRDFNVPLENLNVDREGTELASFKQKTTNTMSANLIKEIGKFYAVRRISANASIPKGNYWVVDGQFERVNQGSRAMRMFIGLGAGGTKMETTVNVTDTSLSPAQSILQFDTTGGSGAMPGLASNPTPSGAVADFAVGSSTGITDDTERTARMIAARLSVLLGQQGWISEDKVQEYKPLEKD